MLNQTASTKLSIARSVIRSTWFNERLSNHVVTKRCELQKRPSGSHLGALTSAEGMRDLPPDNNDCEIKARS